MQGAGKRPEPNHDWTQGSCQGKVQLARLQLQLQLQPPQQETPLRGGPSFCPREQKEPQQLVQKRVQHAPLHVLRWAQQCSWGVFLASWAKRDREQWGQRVLVQKVVAPEPRAVP